MGGGNAIVIKDQAQWDQHVKAGKKTVGTLARPFSAHGCLFDPRRAYVLLQRIRLFIMLLCAKMALTNRCLSHPALRGSWLDASYKLLLAAQVIVDFTATW